MLSILRVGDLEIDVDRRRVSRAGNRIKLTRTEFDILVYLAKNADYVVNADVILEKVWGPDCRDNQLLRVHVAHLRRKIEPNPAAPSYILTEHGTGYRLAVPSAEQLCNAFGSRETEK